MSCHYVSFLVAGSYRFGEYTDAKGDYLPRIEDDLKKGTLWHPFVVEYNKYLVVEPAEEDIVKYLNKRVNITVAYRSINIIITGVIGRLTDRHGRKIPILEINKPELLSSYALLPAANIIKGNVREDKDDNEELHNGVHPMSDQPDLRFVVQTPKPAPKHRTAPRVAHATVISHVVPSAPPLSPHRAPSPAPSAPPHSVPVPRPSTPALAPAPKPAAPAPALAPAPAPKPAAPVVEEDNSCVVCMEEPRTIAFACGHIVCETCAPKLTLCPICRAKIGLRIKLFV